MKTKPRNSGMLTTAEVAQVLHIHPNTLRRWSNAGRIKAYHVNQRGDRRFKREEIAQFLDELSGHDNGDQEAGSSQLSR